MLIAAPSELGLPQIDCPSRNSRSPCHRRPLHFQSRPRKNVAPRERPRERQKRNTEKAAAAQRLEHSHRYISGYAAEANAAQTQKNAIKSNELELACGLFVHITNPTTHPPPAQPSSGGPGALQRQMHAGPDKGDDQQSKKNAVHTSTCRRRSPPATKTAPRKEMSRSTGNSIGKVERQAQAQPDATHCSGFAEFTGPLAAGSRHSQAVGACFRRIAANSFETVRAHPLSEVRLPHQ